MKIVLMILLAIASLILIASVPPRSQKTPPFSGSQPGGAGQPFGKKKSQGYEALLEKVTAIGAVLFIVLSLVIVTME